MRGRYNSSKEKREQILGETKNSSSHKNDERANVNTMEVPKTSNVLINRNHWHAFANAFTNSTNKELS